MKIIALNKVRRLIIFIASYIVLGTLVSVFVKWQVIGYILMIIYNIIFLIKKDYFLSPKIQKDTNTPVGEMNILEHIENICDITQKHGIEESLSKGESHIEYVTGKLGISPAQAVIFSHFVKKSYDDNINLSDIAGFIQCENTKMIKYILDVEELEKKRLIACSRNTWGNTYRMSSEVSVSLLKNNNYIPGKNIIVYDEIKPKKMHYNLRETGEVQKLISMLSEENYEKIMDRLSGKSMRKGFACLFSGTPGTGKTETAYQVARETKRNIMMVDISETKSCWHGESEKKIKEVFDSYRIAVEDSKIAPILLLNEADAIIGSRRDIGKTNPSHDETANRMQNIILQEMENLSGILIATTNLVQNMDKAFDRRFLYKIVFEKPTVQSRIGIWNSLLPSIAEETAAELSSRFELSGGQIENIARKTEVDFIINGEGLSMDTLVEYCKAETANDPGEGKRIGFGNRD